MPPPRRPRTSSRTNIIAFDVSEQLAITDAFVLCSADNDRQVKAIVDAIEERLRQMGAKPVRREGEREGRWVLLDYVDIVVHVQHEEERPYYALERIWRDCPVIQLPADAVSPPRRRSDLGPARDRTRPRDGGLAARPDGMERTRNGAGTDRRTARRDGPGAGGGRAPGWRRCGRSASARATCHARSRRPTSLAALTGLEPSTDPRLREMHMGARQGLSVSRVRRAVSRDRCGLGARGETSRCRGPSPTARSRSAMVPALGELPTLWHPARPASWCRTAPACGWASAAARAAAAELEAIVRGFANCSWAIMVERQRAAAVRVARTRGRLPEPCCPAGTPDFASDAPSG